MLFMFLRLYVKQAILMTINYHFLVLCQAKPHRSVTFHYWILILVNADEKRIIFFWRRGTNKNLLPSHNRHYKPYKAWVNEGFWKRGANKSKTVTEVFENKQSLGQSHHSVLGGYPQSVEVLHWSLGKSNVIGLTLLKALGFSKTSNEFPHGTILECFICCHIFIRDDR